jgi:tRNA pseudouridine55 synthase
LSLDGVLVIDKPRGLTSHDIVAAARRALGETRIGHTGTLDPIATGVLPLACGRATRLVRFLTASDKEYHAEIRLGLATRDVEGVGREVARSDTCPSRAEIAEALETLTGEYLQTPPPYSAKKIAGRRAYELARADVAVQTTPVRVRVQRLELVDVIADVAAVRLTCSAGFYVRSLAHELGLRLGVGGCLEALRRTRSGPFALADAVGFEILAKDPDAAASMLVPLNQLLPHLPAVILTDEGVRWVSHGRIIGPMHMSGAPADSGAWVRLMSPGGALVGLGEPAGTPGSLHPSIVLN